ncbi:MAG: Uma2 family endonuclease [Planctomycetota bacterium]
MLTLAKKWTERELLRLPKEDGKYELVDGDLVLMSPAHFDHGTICASMTIRLGAYVLEKKLGIIAEGQTGFWMANGNLRSPDISFISIATLSKLERLPTGFFKGAPDLAVEVFSPSERTKQLNGKIADYFASGTKLVWVIYPKSRSARIYRKPNAKRLIGEDEKLDGEDVVPGFKVRVGDLFPRI